jgi:hypothetical protein
MSLLKDFEEFEIRSSLWHRQLDEASEPGQVLEVMRDYLASLTPRDLASLNERCRPNRLKTEEDVTYWTFVLAQYQCRPVDMNFDLFQDVLNHFLHASLCLTAIHRSTTRRAVPPSRAI